MIRSHAVYLEGDQIHIKHGRVYLVPCEKLLVQCTLVQWRTLDKSLFTQYQENTYMFIWSPCTYGCKLLDIRYPLVVDEVVVLSAVIDL